MISLFKSFLLFVLLYGNYTANATHTVKVTCDQLGLYFMLPTGFNSLDSSKIDALSKRGEKAVDEAFEKESLKGWQPACMNLQDSFKRTILISTITDKEAVDLNGSVDKFIEKTFKDGNDFIVQRFKQKANIDIDKKEAVNQTELTIAGYKVKKNAFTFTYGGRLLFFSRYYFFQKNNKLYLLGFTGSPKADNNEEIVTAIENAKLM